ncbi:MAG TPA: hypothetical protein PLK94_00890 [Alphaproteobacteria bacterium]|nr:hypothetical protein [Alphaproteobacteria bacterium]
MPNILDEYIEKVNTLSNLECDLLVQIKSGETDKNINDLVLSIQNLADSIEDLEKTYPVLAKFEEALNSLSSDENKERLKEFFSVVIEGGTELNEALSKVSSNLAFPSLPKYDFNDLLSGLSEVNTSASKINGSFLSIGESLEATVGTVKNIVPALEEINDCQDTFSAKNNAIKNGTEDIYAFAKAIIKYLGDEAVPIVSLLLEQTEVLKNNTAKIVDLISESDSITVSIQNNAKEQEKFTDKVLTSADKVRDLHFAYIHLEETLKTLNGKFLVMMNCIEAGAINAQIVNEELNGLNNIKFDDIMSRMSGMASLLFDMRQYSAELLRNLNSLNGREFKFKVTATGNGADSLRQIANG